MVARLFTGIFSLCFSQMHTRIALSIFAKMLYSYYCRTSKIPTGVSYKGRSEREVTYSFIAQDVCWRACHCISSVSYSSALMNSMIAKAVCYTYYKNKNN